MNIYEQLAAENPISQELRSRFSPIMAQELVGTVRLPYSFYAAAGKGSRITDADGNEKIDLTMALGPLILGHCHPVAVNAAKDALDRAQTLGLPNPYQGELAELLVEASPCAEQAMFCNTGTEATMYAIRLARAITGKTKIAMFDGCYHGAHDCVIMHGVLKPDPREPGHKPMGHGVPRETADQVMFLPYRDPHAFELIAKHGHELACVLIEPVQSSNPRLDVGPYLKELREACSRAGILLIFDEVITGFRMAYGGGQERFDVIPDLATYGKVLGGGMPIGAVAGSRELMKPFDLAGAENAIFAGGTFGGNPVSMITGAAVLRHLKTNPGIYADLKEKGDRLASEVNAFLKAGDYPAQLMHADSLFHLIWAREPIERARSPRHEHMDAENLFYAHLLKRGVIIPGLHLFFISSAHSDEDIDIIIAAVKASFEAVRNEMAI